MRAVTPAVNLPGNLPPLSESDSDTEGLKPALGLDSASGLDSALGLESASGLDSALGSDSASGLDSALGSDSASGLESVSGLESASGESASAVSVLVDWESAESVSLEWEADLESAYRHTADSGTTASDPQSESPHSCCSGCRDRRWPFR